MAEITLEKVKGLLAREEERYARERPESKELYEKACHHYVGGVPMSWMRIWPGGFPIFVREAEGAKLVDVDGHTYLDLCLGDTGALLGHSPPALIGPLAEQLGKGITTMLPHEGCIEVGKELSRRFGLPFWQVLMTASDANRMALKVAREFTGRRLILAFNASYHGSVDETLVVDFYGNLLNMPGLMGPLVEDPSTMTRIVEFNDVEALEEALSPRDVACVITEPVMTNVGIIHPEPGFHETLRSLTRKYGTLLLIDETHSICGGPAGMTGELNLEPDIFVLGKLIAGGYPAAVLGFSREIAEMVARRVPWHNFFGFGGTLSGNPPAVAAIKATLDHLLTEESFAHMIPLARKMEEGIAAVIERHSLPWYVGRVGCRVEFRFLSEPPRRGIDTLMDVEYNEVDLISEGLTGPLEALIHVYCTNRGILLSPVHDMALVSPVTTEEDVDHYVRVVGECVEELVN
ncbi:MAG: aminotransferase class III-fold pyridoxal phosphate-dependent enzyme [Firmicutes bacterium]|mgnify:CR=1 FL=1|jgi:glutamate-1-semialdehyde 2,1-aminomutase|nr:aminotransferase class III-fold pyridoxal phosphate-dependent enzyme [Bacillota bacterium]